MIFDGLHQQHFLVLWLLIQHILLDPEEKENQLFVNKIKPWMYKKTLYCQLVQRRTGRGGGLMDRTYQIHFAFNTLYVSNPQLALR